MTTIVVHAVKDLIGVMKMNKEECLKALKTLQDKYLNLDVVDELICFKSLIEEHFDNPPLYYAEIEEGKWYWHNKKKEWVKVLNKDVCTSDIPIIETDNEYIEFELNCFYRKQVEE